MWSRRTDGGRAFPAARAVAVALGFVWAATALAAPATSDEAKFKLKPGAKGKLCVGCHSDFEDLLKLPAVHTPVKAGDCIDCHSPHDSDHGKLLAAAPGAICTTCHAGIVPDGAKSVHPALEGGACVSCHDPHASRFKNNLRTAGNELCVSCHKEIGEQVAKVKFRHPPVASGCVTCHDPHASTKSDFLLVKDQSALCTSCHKPDAAPFKAAHMGYPVAKGRCTSCHDPHGSDNQAILWPNVHKPVASKLCAQCHNDAASPKALQTKKSGIEVCRGCHADLVNEALDAGHLHWPVADKVACLNCHNPHASKEPKLVKAPLPAVCGNCHGDTIRRQASSLTKHPPIEQGDCTSCHQPHAADNAFLFVNANTLELCGACHDWQQHSGHPIGAKAIDPRDKNLTLDCESCHRTHGTPFKSFTHLDAKGDLCVQCHKTFRR
jgi:predicted CXXCH cytochrome family protein